MSTLQIWVTLIERLLALISILIEHVRRPEGAHAGERGGEASDHHRENERSSETSH